MSRGKQLAEICIDEGKLGADADAGEKARHDQGRDVRTERAEQREYGIDAEIDEKRGPPPARIGKPPEERRAEEHPDEARGDDGRQRGSREMKLLRQNGGEYARQEDVEQIEERSDARDDRRVAVNRRRRKAVQPRRNRGSRVRWFVGSQVRLGNATSRVNGAKTP
jgi:hypothetical protein